MSRSLTCSLLILSTFLFVGLGVNINRNSCTGVGRSVSLGPHTLRRPTPPSDDRTLGRLRGCAPYAEVLVLPPTGSVGQAQVSVAETEKGVPETCRGDHGPFQGRWRRVRVALVSDAHCRDWEPKNKTSEVVTEPRITTLDVLC